MVKYLQDSSPGNGEIKIFNNMEPFIASRLTGGNRVFRSKIIIDELGVTLKDPRTIQRKRKNNTL